MRNLIFFGITVCVFMPDVSSSNTLSRYFKNVKVGCYIFDSIHENIPSLFLPAKNEKYDVFEDCSFNMKGSFKSGQSKLGVFNCTSKRVHWNFDCIKQNQMSDGLILATHIEECYFTGTLKWKCSGSSDSSYYYFSSASGQKFNYYAINFQVIGDVLPKRFIRKDRITCQGLY